MVAGSRPERWAAADSGDAHAQGQLHEVVLVPGPEQVADDFPGRRIDPGRVLCGAIRLGFDYGTATEHAIAAGGTWNRYPAARRDSTLAPLHPSRGGAP